MLVGGSEIMVLSLDRQVKITLYHHEKIDCRPRDFPPSPTLMAGIFQPNHSVTTRRAKISPNPSMTPLIKGRTRLMAREDANTSARVRVDKEESKMDSVAEMGGF